MKIVFFGTPFFAATNLEFLYENNIEIVFIVSAPDREKGRGLLMIRNSRLDVGLYHADAIRHLVPPLRLGQLRKFDRELCISVMVKRGPVGWSGCIERDACTYLANAIR